MKIFPYIIMIQQRIFVKKNYYLLVILSLLITLPSCSLQNEIKFNKTTVYGENESTLMGFAFGDLNGDDLIDLVVHEGGFGGALKWYEQTISGYWIENIIADTAESGVHFSAGDLEIGDIDNDGDIDILGFEHPGEWQYDYSGDTLATKIYWFENNGIASSWKSHIIGVVDDFVKDADLIDFDNDTKLDLVTITYRDKHNFSVFKQVNENKWIRVQDFKINNLHEGMDCGDIDGDGDYDVAANGYWIENPGGDLTGEWKVRVVNSRWHDQTEEHWRKNATKIFCADIDDDGRSEIFISHSEKTGYPVAWYNSENPVVGNWKEYIISENFTAAHTLQVADINNDGSLDVLVGENGAHTVKEDNELREVRLFLNSGDNLQWEEIFIRDDGLYNGILQDINDDGFVDICGARGHSKDPYEIWYTSFD